MDGVKYDTSKFFLIFGIIQTLANKESVKVITQLISKVIKHQLRGENDEVICRPHGLWVEPEGQSKEITWIPAVQPGNWA